MDPPFSSLYELTFSDDWHLFGRFPEGVNRVLDAVFWDCSHAGGRPNLQKLKAYRVQLSGDILGLSRGTSAPPGDLWS